MKLRSIVPKSVRHSIQRYVSLQGLKNDYRIKSNPYRDIQDYSPPEKKYDTKFGIIKNTAQYHSHYMAACIEMGIAFRVIDVFKNNWIQELRNANDCSAFLIWPEGTTTVLNQAIKEKANVMVNDIGLRIFPSLDEIRFYENKRVTAYWLESHGIPHPKTYVFYNLDECLDFISKSTLPLVFKTNLGATASGVIIGRKRSQLEKAAKLSFGSGFIPGGADLHDRQWGSVILQEYLDDPLEWRMVRIGDSYFGHQKGRIADFHSGSGSVKWDVPEKRHLDFLHNVTHIWGFISMNVDLFETKDGRLLVNELHTVFGASHSVDQLRVNGVNGRFVRDQLTDKWVFEPGEFARNACANERIRCLLETLHIQELVQLNHE